MTQGLVFRDGTELEDSSVVESGDRLWVYVYADVGFAELFALLNDPDKTEVITSVFGDVEKTHEGFNELFCIRKEDSGFISAGLRK